LAWRGHLKEGVGLLPGQRVSVATAHDSSLPYVAGPG
jgi:hypothetical protein